MVLTWYFSNLKLFDPKEFPRSTVMGWKDIRIRKSEFVANTQFLWFLISAFGPILIFVNTSYIFQGGGGLPGPSPSCAISSGWTYVHVKDNVFPLLLTMSTSKLGRDIISGAYKQTSFKITFKVKIICLAPPTFRNHLPPQKYMIAQSSKLFRGFN